jgi:hypothetical protein
MIIKDSTKKFRQGSGHGERQIQEITHAERICEAMSRYAKPSANQL